MTVKHGDVVLTVTSLYQRLAKQKTKMRLEFSGQLNTFDFLAKEWERITERW